jgi:hypothetical protein
LAAVVKKFPNYAYGFDVTQIVINYNLWQIKLKGKVPYGLGLELLSEKRSVVELL